MIRAHRHGWIGVGPQRTKKEKKWPGYACPWARETKQNKKQNAQETSFSWAIPCFHHRCLPLLPISLWCGKLRGGPRWRVVWAVSPQLFPSTFIVFSSPRSSLSLIPIVVVVIIPRRPFLPHSWGCCGGGLYRIFISPLFIVHPPTL